MTSEPNTAQDYLEDVKIGGTTKRWQGAFELSKILSNPKQVPKDDRFVAELISTFKYATNDRDIRVKQYLALAMGATKDIRYTQSLIEALDRPEPELNTVKNAIDLLIKAQKPIIIAGGGANTSGARKELIEIAEK